MAVLGDVIYTLAILIPFLTIFLKSNVIATLTGMLMGTIGFLVFVTNQTDITFSSSTFYLAFLPLALALLNFAFFFNWLREERI